MKRLLKRLRPRGYGPRRSARAADGHDRDAQARSDELALGRIARSRLLDPVEYLRVHPDVRMSGRSALDHYARNGFKEGRRPYSEEYGAGLLGSIDGSYAADKAAFLAEGERERSEAAPARPSTGPVVLFVHSRGNYFMLPIAETLRRCLEKAGVAARVRTELGPEPRRTDVNVVVAPHEFFELELPPAFRSLPFRTECLIFNTEQVPSHHFALALRDILPARGVIDVSFQSHRLFSEFMPSLYMLPGFDKSSLEPHLSLIDEAHPLFLSTDIAGFGRRGVDQPLADRPLDVFYAGFANGYRDRFFARNAEYLAGRECFLAYARDGGAPATAEGWSAVFANNLAVTLNTRIVLAIHRFPTGFIEWERMVVQGFASGALVLATPGIQSPHFEPGRHYLECPLRHMGLLIRDILESPDGLARAQAIADQGRRQLWSDLSEGECGRRLARFIADVAAVR